LVADLQGNAMVFEEIGGLAAGCHYFDDN